MNPKLRNIRRRARWPASLVFGSMKGLQPLVACLECGFDAQPATQRRRVIVSKDQALEITQICSERVATNHNVAVTAGLIGVPYVIEQWCQIK